LLLHIIIININIEDIISNSILSISIEDIISNSILSISPDKWVGIEYVVMISRWSLSIKWVVEYVVNISCLIEDVSCMIVLL